LSSITETTPNAPVGGQHRGGRRDARRGRLVAEQRRQQREEHHREQHREEQRGGFPDDRAQPLGHLDLKIPQVQRPHRGFRDHDRTSMVS
jgi:hypothetical protein